MQPIPPRHTPKPPRRGMVLFPLLTAGVVVLLMFKLAEFAVTSGIITPRSAAPSPTGNPFDDMALLHPKGKGTALASLKPQRATVPAFTHNIQLGQADAPLTLTLFTDPGCTNCRTQVKEMVAQTQGRPVKVILKSWPQNQANTSALMFLELARRQGQADTFLKLLDNEKQDLTEERLITLLEKVGIPLENQRPLFTEQAESILRTIGKDIEQGQEIGLATSSPQVVLNDYVIDGNILSTTRLGLYMDRLLNNESPIQAADVWLNPSR